MSTKAHRFVGLAKQAILPADIPVEIAIVPARVTNVRSNQRRSAREVTTVTLHETANFNKGADAEMHKRWLHGGASGAAVGFNFVVDDKKIIQLTPLDEVTWAAGTPAGNRTSDHIELCVHAGIDHAKARRNAAALVAALLYARGLPASKMVQHNVWYGKNCPLLIRRDGLWPMMMNMVSQFIIAINTGGTPQPDLPTDNWKRGTKAITTDNLNVRQGSGTNYKITTTLPSGTGVEVIDGPRTANGYTWYDVKGTFGTGWVASDWLQALPEEEEPSEGWPYPKPVAPAWWDDLMEGTHIVDGGNMWFRTNGYYRAVRDTKRLGTASGSAEEIGPMLKKGEEFRAAAAGPSGIDGKPYVITEGLTRVAMTDLEYVEED